MKKRIMIMLTVAALSVSSALADPVSDFIAEHNLNRIMNGASEIIGQPDIEKGKYIYHLRDLDIVLSENEGKVSSFSCVCLDDSATGEFLAQCVTGFYDIGGIEAYSICYGELLSEYLAARAGIETKSNSAVPGVLFQVAKTGSRYIFIIVKVK